MCLRAFDSLDVVIQQRVVALFRVVAWTPLAALLDFPQGEKKLSQLWYILNITKYKGLFGSAENIFWAEKNIHENPNPQKASFYVM